MSNQDFDRQPPASNRDRLGQRTAKAASDALSSASVMAGEAATKAKQAASETVETVTGQVKASDKLTVNSALLVPLPPSATVTSARLNDAAEAAIANSLLLAASHPSAERTVTFNCAVPLSSAV